MCKFVLYATERHNFMHLLFREQYLQGLLPINLFQAHCQCILLLQAILCESLCFKHLAAHCHLILYWKRSIYFFFLAFGPAQQTCMIGKRNLFAIYPDGPGMIHSALDLFVCFFKPLRSKMNVGRRNVAAFDLLANACARHFVWLFLWNLHFCYS